MKTIQFNAYTLPELKAQFPEGYARAVREWQDNQTEIFWQDETIDSLKACLKMAGVSLRDWSLGAYNRGNHIKIEFSQEEAGDLIGKRAFAWLENNLFSKLRVQGNTRIDDWRNDKRSIAASSSARFYRTLDGKLHRREGMVGEIPSCPLTGYCSDQDYLDALRKSVRQGCTLKEAFEGLADTCQKLLEQEAESQASEEYFADHAANEMHFTEKGERI